MNAPSVQLTAERRAVVAILVLGVVLLISLGAVENVGAGGGAAGLTIRRVCASGCEFTKIQAAVDAVQPGDVIEVHGGIYNEAVVIHKDGTAEGWITLRTKAGEAVWIEGAQRRGSNIDFGEHAYWRVQGVKGRNAGCTTTTCNVNQESEWVSGIDGIKIGRKAHHIVIQDVEIARSSGDGIDLAGHNQSVSILESEIYEMQARKFQFEGDGHGIHVTVVDGAPATRDILVRGNNVHDSSGKACLALADYSSLDSPYRPENVIFEHNRVFDCTNGIKVNHDGIFRYNLVVDTGKNRDGGFKEPYNGFQAFTHDDANNVRAVEIYNNTVVGFHRSYNFDLSNSSPAQTVAVFKNNIAYMPTYSLAVLAVKTAFPAQGNNLFFCGETACRFEGYAPEAGSNLDPRFLNEAAGDYSLKADSPAIDAGARIYLEQPFHGQAPDIGAFEFVASMTFVDVPADHPYYAEIEALYQAGYTAGCGTDPLRYCPDETMIRAESAVFVERGIRGANYEPSVPAASSFADVPVGYWGAGWIEGLWEDEYTAGCGADPLTYCPLQKHTRAEGCVFYLRMLNGPDYQPPEASGEYADVLAGWWGAGWVEAAVEAGLIEPCETEPEVRFCPQDPLDRGLAASMMVRAKGLHGWD